MGLIWNEENQGHDITDRGVVKYQIKRDEVLLDTASAVTDADKEKVVKDKINLVLKVDGIKIQIHYFTFPDNYALWKGSTEQDPPDEWWQTGEPIELGEANELPTRT